METPTIQFTASGTDVTVRAPRYGASGAKTTVARQHLKISEGGQITHYGLGTNDQAWHLVFNGMSQTDKTNLENFVIDGVSFGSDTFSYVDPWGTTHATCRFVMGEFNFQPMAYQKWRGALLVRKDIS